MTVCAKRKITDSIRRGPQESGEVPKNGPLPTEAGTVEQRYEYVQRSHGGVEGAEDEIRQDGQNSL